MHRLTNSGRAVLIVIALLLSSQLAHAAAPASDSNNRISQASPARVKFTKAFIIDDRLSALRREPGLKSQIINRLRLGRPVYIIGSKRVESEGSAFYRVAVTRRTRGWMLESALVVPGRAGEDERIMKMIELAGDSLERIALCQFFAGHFSRSALLPRVLLRMGREAERTATSLNRRARKRLADADARNVNASLRDYFLNDPGLDRYSRLRVVFNFNDAATGYMYDGKAYREIIRRFPQSEEAKPARQRLDLSRQKLARRQ